MEHHLRHLEHFFADFDFRRVREIEHLIVHFGIEIHVTERMVKYSETVLFYLVQIVELTVLEQLGIPGILKTRRNG